MEKYKVTDVEIRNGQYGEYKIATLEDEHGIPYESVMLTARQSFYRDAVVGGTIECKLEPNDKGYLRAVGERKNKKDRDWEGEERRRTMRINWWASMNNAVQLMPEHADWTDEEIEKFLNKWGSWFLKKCQDYEKNIK